jgi:hypothetical protein
MIFMKDGRTYQFGHGDNGPLVTGMTSEDGFMIVSTEQSETWVPIGHRGGLKGGPARAKTLTAKQRSAIARKGGQSKGK